jgi:uncharacterized integral membrane protein
MMLVVLLVVIFMASNFEQIEIKFLWWDIWQVPAFALILASASLGITFFLISRQIRKVLGEVRNLRREDKTREKLIKEIKQKVEQKGDSD